MLCDVIRDLKNAEAFYRICIPARGLRRFCITGPAYRDGFVSIRTEKLDPVVPGLRVQPESMHKDDWIPGGLPTSILLRTLQVCAARDASRKTRLTILQGFEDSIEETTFNKKLSTFAEPLPKLFVTIDGPLITVEARQVVEICLPG